METSLPPIAGKYGDIYEPDKCPLKNNSDLKSYCGRRLRINLHTTILQKQ